METKSRYEVIAGLEEQKRNLIKQRDAFPKQIKAKKDDIKQVVRRLEDMNDDLKFFVESVKDNKQTINDLIESVDLSLKKFDSKK